MSNLKYAEKADKYYTGQMLDNGASVIAIRFPSNLRIDRPLVCTRLPGGKPKNFFAELSDVEIPARLRLQPMIKQVARVI